MGAQSDETDARLRHGSGYAYHEHIRSSQEAACMWFAKQPANLDVEVKQSAQSLAWQLFCLSHALASSDSAQGHQQRDDSKSHAEELLKQLGEVGLRPARGKVIRKLLLQANADTEQLAKRMLKLARRRKRHLRGNDQERDVIEMTVASVEASRARLQEQRRHLRELSWPRRMFLAADGRVAAAASVPSLLMGTPASALSVPTAPVSFLAPAANPTPSPTTTAALRGASKVPVPRQRI